MPDWNPDLYLKFEKERTQPAIDLANRIGLSSPQDILDIGCGPGNSTAVLHKKYPGARILGIDSSQKMIETARAAFPHIEFQVCDASRDLAKLGRRFDVVFSNACLQWIPDHPSLLRNMMSLLKEGGVMAVQIPMNQKEPIHQILARLAAGEKWRKKIPCPRVFYSLTPSAYYDLLAVLSRDFSLWQTTYCHRLQSHADLIEWYRATGLRPYLEALPPADRENFEHEVTAEVAKAYPPQQNGEILFPFPRFFFTAIK